MLLAIIALCCVALIGFAAHRASLCNVRAVADLFHPGSADMMWSLLQAMLWTLTLTGLLTLVFGLVPQPSWSRTPLAWAWAGGLLFGVGAAVNGGCSMSTLTRLADGDLGMLAALAGFLAGVTTWFGVQAAGWPAGLVPVVSPWLRWPQLAPWLLAALLAWALYRVHALWRLGRGRFQLKAAVLAPIYPLSVSAALMGLAAGLLYATQGPWSYTNYLRSQLLNSLDQAPAPSMWHGLLVLGLLAGMVGSALQRGSFGWRRPRDARGWLRHIGGGALMGAGAAMVPGGNDTLLLGSLPALTVSALITYLAMLAGIALVLGVRRGTRSISQPT
ncbi:MAG TPA: YeeE/YedE thiosulfate transporter family protein [Ramlibacter sp.]|nr:YeeE/YedE thiosulfate transporter family protein [Ramlibacter sp.]